MGIIASAGSGGDGDFTPAPAGTYRAICVDVIDKGWLKVAWQGKESLKHKISVAWLIDELREDGKPYLVFKRYTLSLHKKAVLRADLESWRGRAFTDEETAGFDVERLLGVSCIVNIQQVPRDGRTYANVVSVMPLMKGMVAMDGPFDYVRQVNRPKTDAPTSVQPVSRQPGEDDEPPPLTDDDLDSIPF